MPMSYRACLIDLDKAAQKGRSATKDKLAKKKAEAAAKDAKDKALVAADKAAAAAAKKDKKKTPKKTKKTPKEEAEDVVFDHYVKAMGAAAVAASALKSANLKKLSATKKKVVMNDCCLRVGMKVAGRWDDDDGTPG